MVLRTQELTREDFPIGLPSTVCSRMPCVHRFWTLETLSSLVPKDWDFVQHCRHHCGPAISNFQTGHVKKFFGVERTLSNFPRPKCTHGKSGALHCSGCAECCNSHNCNMDAVSRRKVAELAGLARLLMRSGVEVVRSPQILQQDA
jgi:hypothetical protein